MSPASTGFARALICTCPPSGIASRALTAEIHDRQFELVRVDVDRGETGLELGGDLDRGSKRAPQHLDHAVNEVDHIHDFRPELLTPSKCEQAFR